MFRGIYIPLVTPFYEGDIDWESLERLIEYYIEKGVDGLVPCGTTGESPTLSEKEHMDVIKFVVEKTKGRTRVIAGTGSNETKKALEFTKEAENLGADAALVVCPYYNKPTQEGILAHYRKIAENTSLPIIIYNIPGRTGRNIEVNTLLKLAEVENIVGVKEASGDINQLLDTIMLRPEGFSVLAGEDHLIYVNCALGGDGAIAASAHILPDLFKRMCELAWQGNAMEASQINFKLLPLVRLFFAETNPCPVKTALKLMGLIKSDEVRLPLVPTSPNLSKRIEEELKKLGVIS
ncbi:MAG: 4-hydroxy-tetrahydrodipicolinate synthase [Actinobacteria bacterium]|nr:4-hydroxy-tetrahydrodipicolinate synthase [Actinomycetota bacterium]